MLAKALTEKWGQQVIIDHNQPGGNGAVAAQTIKSAGSDGYYAAGDRRLDVRHQSGGALQQTQTTTTSRAGLGAGRTAVRHHPPERAANTLAEFIATSRPTPAR